MARIDYGKDRLQQRINRQHIEDRIYGDKLVRRKRKRNPEHALPKLTRFEVNELRSRLINAHGMSEEDAFGIVRDEMFRLAHNDRQRANKTKLKPPKRNRRKR